MFFNKIISIIIYYCVRLHSKLLQTSKAAVTSKNFMGKMATADESHLLFHTTISNAKFAKVSEWLHQLVDGRTYLEILAFLKNDLCNTLDRTLSIMLIRVCFIQTTVRHQ